MRVGAIAPLAGSGPKELTLVNSEDHDREERTRLPFRPVFVQHAIFQTSPKRQPRTPPVNPLRNSARMQRRETSSVNDDSIGTSFSKGNPQNSKDTAQIEMRRP